MFIKFFIKFWGPNLLPNTVKYFSIWPETKTIRRKILNSIGEKYWKSKRSVKLYALSILAPKFLDLLFSWKLDTGGKPSTWFPPGGLVELINRSQSILISWRWSTRQTKVCKIADHRSGFLDHLEKSTCVNFSSERLKNNIFIICHVLARKSIHWQDAGFARVPNFDVGRTPVTSINSLKNCHLDSPGWRHMTNFARCFFDSKNGPQALGVGQAAPPYP